MPQSKTDPIVLDSHQKPPLVLVHGFRGSPIGLKDVAKALTQYGYQVYTPPIPPFGGAAKLRHYTPDQYSDYLASYIKKHQLYQPVLIGHSMGSIVVSAFISKYPQLVNHKSVLLSPISNRTAAPFRIVAPLSAVLPRRAIDYITTKYLFVPRDKKLLRQILEITDACSGDQPPLRREVLKAATFSTRYCVNDFNPPQQVFMLAGEKDRLIKKKNTIKAAKKMQATVDFLPRTGHLHNYEQPYETAAKIIHFLES